MMRTLKRYFKLLLTAVICFAMCFTARKNVMADTEEILTDGQAVSTHKEEEGVFPQKQKKRYVTVHKEEQAEKYKYRAGLFLKKVFFWLKGPGDRSGEIDPRSGRIIFP